MDPRACCRKLVALGLTLGAALGSTAFGSNDVLDGSRARYVNYDSEVVQRGIV
jgi:hypothetical protein